ncbi:TetR/AcrR family transcriptional regulator [Rudaeicoccus suwonensis]|uniref:TetR family transcriptional regulator n=1 Tax=Rudaeicoccus suwonensis TaxID=657409 RepID=A0A561E9U4_9MICO|nr:TetR/AcrR family transcriptional regulator [Rudaeicoccus suwonensis]TWE12393.1 TetR family transcriptional regulator [Rudaeicoccus suwonensis]
MSSLRTTTSLGSSPIVDAVRPAVDDSLATGADVSLSPNADDRRGYFVQVALEQWAESGYHSVTMRNVAGRSEFSHGLLSYYFGSREQLVRECLDFSCRSLADSFAQVPAGPLSVDEVAHEIAGSVIEREVHHRVRLDLRNLAMFDETGAEFSESCDGAYEASLGALLGRITDENGQAAFTVDATVHTAIDGLVRRQLSEHAPPMVEDGLLEEELVRLLNALAD